MIFLQQAGAAILLVLLTLCLQCAGVAALITWLRSVAARGLHDLRMFHSAALVMQTTVAVIILHGIVILLWASCYRGLCLPSWESAFYFSASSLYHGRIRGCGPPDQVATVGPFREYGGHADVRNLGGTSIRGDHPSCRRQVTISSTTSPRTRESGLNRLATEAKLLLRSVAVQRRYPEKLVHSQYGTGSLANHVIGRGQIQVRDHSGVERNNAAP